MNAERAAFENIDFTRDLRGVARSATGFCVTCDDDRQLDVAPFTGAYGVKCPVCGASQWVKTKGS